MSTEEAEAGFVPEHLLRQISKEIVGLKREAELLAVALQSGRHVLLEGPPGTGKSTLLRVVADEAGLGLAFAEGNAELTPARLVGYHDPAMVLQSGYVPEAFVEGPLVMALRTGMVLYVEELNRVPEETLNVLITALAEGEIHVPRVGRIEADPRFRLIAAMNPFDAVGTARVSQAIYDRMCRVAVGYQSEPAEREIVTRVTGIAGTPGATLLVELAVGLIRATRAHREVRYGSSVRGAIDLVYLALGLIELRGESTPSRDTLLDAALAAVSGRIRLEDGSNRSAEEVITELLDRLLVERSQGASGGEEHQGKAPSPGGAPGGEGQGKTLEGEDARRAVQEAAGRTVGRRELLASHENAESVTPQVGQLDEAAFEQLWQEDPEAALDLLTDMANATDVELRRAARRLAARVFVRLAAKGASRSRGVRRLRSDVRHDLGDLDIDRTLERTGGLRPRRADELVVRRWEAHTRSICLLIDRSGSMRGRAVAIAAVAAASTLIAAGEKGDCSVIAFSNDAIVLQGQGMSRPIMEIVGDVVSLRGKGMTDLAYALRVGARQLSRSNGSERIVLLLSDCLSTAGEDPLEALAGIDRLHVLGTAPDPDAESIRWSEELARRGGGRYLRAERPDELGAALTALLA
ncbi:MAG: AAA family ATPase [Acidimicrobiia bacterium]